MRSGEQEAAAELAVTRVLRDAETLETLEDIELDLLTETELETEPAAELDLLREAELDTELDLTTAELEAELALLETLTDLDGVAEGLATAEPEAPAPQANPMLLTCQVVLVEENPEKVMPEMALALEPEKSLNGKVTFWLLPVRPVTCQ